MYSRQFISRSCIFQSFGIDRVLLSVISKMSKFSSICLADVFFCSVAEYAQLCFVGPEYVACATEPVHRDRRLVQKVQELLRSRSEP